MRQFAAINLTFGLCLLGVSCFATPTPTLADGASWRAAKLKQHDAGVRPGNPANNPAIVGGTVASAGKWPFQVALLYVPWGPNTYDSEWCGGSLVDSFHVVTAAHCVHGQSTSKLLVLTGTQSLTSGGVIHAIARITAHPSYNDHTTDYDIAVITLATPATGIAYYATLMNQWQEAKSAKTGTSSYVIGWGSTKASGGGYPTALMQVGVPLVSRTNCNDSNSYDGDITARMICAGQAAGGKDACDGDSGGPLLVKNASGQYRLQAGIVSWGDGCAKKNFFGVYSRVAVLSAWVHTVISSEGSLVATLTARARK